jgi:hypothetical protein
MITIAWGLGSGCRRLETFLEGADMQVDGHVREGRGRIRSDVLRGGRDRVADE